ncbi:major facilitator superfamily transporter, partial [Colletotrichum incanum]
LYLAYVNAKMAGLRIHDKAYKVIPDEKDVDIIINRDTSDTMDPEKGPRTSTVMSPESHHRRWTRQRQQGPPKAGFDLETLSVQAAVIILPTIGQDIGTPEARLQWVVSAYSLTLGCFLLLRDRITDMYDKRINFVAETASLAVMAFFFASFNNVLIFATLFYQNYQARSTLTTT